MHLGSEQVADWLPGYLKHMIGATKPRPYIVSLLYQLLHSSALSALDSSISQIFSIGIINANEETAPRNNGPIHTWSRDCHYCCNLTVYMQIMVNNTKLDQLCGRAIIAQAAGIGLAIMFG